MPKKAVKKFLARRKLKAKKHIKKKIVQKKAKKFLSKKKSPLPLKVQEFSPKSFFKAKIKVIGIGGGGNSIVSEMGRTLHKASFVVADTDVRAFKKRRGIKQFLFGQEMTHGLGTGLNTNLAKIAAEQEKEKISKLFQDQDIIIFVASLGGGLGSGATQVFAEVSRDFNGISFGIFTLPFRFEGKNRQKIAAKALRQLRGLLNVSLTIPNEKIFKVIDENTSITDAFSIVNKNLIESLESLIDLIYNPGIINIDFADLRTILTGRGNLAFLNTAEAQGKDRSETIIHQILHNPLYQSNAVKAQKVLFNIAGGSNLSMFEVDKISRTISEQNPNAKIIFGISKDSSFKNKIKTTLLMTGLGQNILKPQKISKVKTAKTTKKIFVKLRTAKNLKRTNRRKLAAKQLMPIENILPPVFGVLPEQAISAKKLSILESSQGKKAIRRSGLEIKKAQEIEEQEKTQQEKEWEIPAFLRKIKFKP